MLAELGVWATRRWFRRARWRSWGGATRAQGPPEPQRRARVSERSRPHADARRCTAAIAPMLNSASRIMLNAGSNPAGRKAASRTAPPKMPTSPRARLDFDPAPADRSRVPTATDSEFRISGANSALGRWLFIPSFLNCVALVGLIGDRL